jgi:hypothetical protein
MGEMRNAYKILVGISEEKRRIGRSSRRWEYRITLDVREIRLEVMDWINLAQDREQGLDVMNMIMNLRVP